MGDPAEADRYLLINRRRWRRGDPSIPEKLRAELVAELMDARRAVGAARRAPDDAAEAAARARVQDAKVALGVRGPAWWDEPDEEALSLRAQAAARALLRHRDPGTICPSDAARIVGGEQWRSRMTLVRTALLALRRDGQLVLRQRGEEVEDKEVRGPIRFALRSPSGPEEVVPSGQTT